MELERYHELRTLLQQWKARLAGNIRRQIENAAHWLTRLQEIYNNEGTDEEFTLWLDRWCRQAAIQFILHVLFLRVLEDRDLLGAIRIRTTDGQKMWARLTRNLGASGYIQWCCWDAAHLLPDLFGPTEYDLILPNDDLAQNFLDEIWRRPDPNRAGWLRFDFRPDAERRDIGFQTRFIGDLYQELDTEIRERYALLQTPHFISQFILEHTLLKRFTEKDFREVTLIDPTCGSGHFEVDAFWLFVAEYEKAAGKDRSSLNSTERTEIARTIIEKHLYGCDINPYAAALTRFRLILAACDYAQPASLQDFRDLKFNIVTIDSLIPYEKLIVSGLRTTSALSQVMGQFETIERALPVLRKRYEVVVGNPPYILAGDAVKRDLYRKDYDSAYRGFHLSVPFTERFLMMANSGARVGIIESNAFANRLFGKKLIETVLPKYDLEAVIDLSGCYIPGHGTPTLILLIKNQHPSSKNVTVLSSLKGEATIPSIPSQGTVWENVKKGFKKGPGFANEFIDVISSSREKLATHPWQFGGQITQLMETLEELPSKLSSLTNAIGAICVTRADEVFVCTIDQLRRMRIPRNFQISMISGEDVRNWIINASQVAVFPYQRNLQVINIGEHPQVQAYLQQYRSILESRVAYGKTQLEHGLKWFEYNMLFRERLNTPNWISFAEIATHNHFVPNNEFRMFRQTAPVVKLIPEHEDDTTFIVAILNSSLCCFFLKQKSYNKGAGDDPVRDRYVYSSTYVGETPLPTQYTQGKTANLLISLLSSEMTVLLTSLPRLRMSKLFEKQGEAFHDWYSSLSNFQPPHDNLYPPFSDSSSLREAVDWACALREDSSQRMIFLQEEMDWLVYEMYGLVKKAPLAHDYLTPSQYEKARLQLGQRAFELAGNGYTGDWPPGYQPDPLPQELKALIEARITIIQSNKDIALLEDPLYKRRWVPLDYEKEFREAAEWWLAEKLEYALEQHGRPISLRRWAGLLAHDERVNATLEVLTGSPMFDLEQELLRIIRANAVPNRPEHYLKPEGLRKFYVQGAEFKSKEFSDSTAWKIRGKLNIPRERFIAYTEFDATQRGVDAPENGGPWFGWAGWDAAQRAEALVYLLEQAGRAGWELLYRQCGLRAALRALLQKGELDHLPEADKLEFEGIAAMCGIGLDTPCYCQAYRDGMARGEPGVPGVTAEVLQVRVLATEKKSPQGRQQKSKGNENQLKLDL